MKGAEMGVALPAQKGLKKMAGIVGKPVNFRKSAHEPARENVYRQGEPVHLGEQGNYKSRKGTKRPPVPPGLGLEKTKHKNQEYGGVYYYQLPEPVIRQIIHR